MAESDTSTVNRALATLSQPVRETREDFIPDMSKEAQSPVVDPFNPYPKGYWANVAAEHKKARQSTVFY